MLRRLYFDVRISARPDVLTQTQLSGDATFLATVLLNQRAAPEGEEGKVEPEGEEAKESATKSASLVPAATGGGSVRWYERAYNYWEDGENCPIDDDGVLGGYGHISPTDIAGSKTFLDELKAMRPLLGDENAAGESCRSRLLGPSNSPAPPATTSIPFIYICVHFFPAA